MQQGGDGNLFDMKFEAELNGQNYSSSKWNGKGSAIMQHIGYRIRRRSDLS